METKGRKCYNCGRYSAYYTKQFTIFDKLNYGKCSFSGEPLQDKYGTCEHWMGMRKRSLRRLKAASAALCKAAESICTIQQILSEADEE